ncbi:hypothetical protein PV08_10378 [Exophiala spinifera]|uniref:RING-type domain-containing protein n=1 Tax=Exophiala spinifera TaxID=91928 RepID=A0A0D2BIA0_9EURO|nr:uncharacterized protein PV08_10378 [Exophiala spinifera]KIW11079.1 hypothetical protein PV08_10378 [Exophiala spinifera]
MQEDELYTKNRLTSWKRTYGLQLRASGLVRTLSQNNPNNYGTIEGLLYVPDLPPSDPCDNATRALIPSNVTTRAQIPGQKYPLIALAPWTQTACVESYLAAMASDNVRGGIFFHPGNESEQPPPVSDPSWSLNDGGNWKGENPYPVYAIPGMLGAFLLDELAQYSGNLSSSPYGKELEDLYDSHDVVRLVARIDVSVTGGIPSLWVFLIIVLAVLLAVVLVTSVIMHWVQRKQRRQLQQRVARGEVDLEALGIKRLNVPQEILDKMPQWIYISSNNDSNGETGLNESVASAEKNSTDTTISAKAVREAPFSQTTCPICLDDFVHDETTVRELPCNHIYHPECIDPFLRENSSLCPLCKKTVLPAGYCPVQVTNIMVRRERLLRRTRQRDAEDNLAVNGSRLPGVTAINRTMRQFSNPLTASRHQHGSAAGEHTTGAEMQAPPQRQQTQVDDEMPAEIRAQGTSARRAWRRERLARQQAREYGQQADQARVVDESRPLWRRIVGRVFPSLE